MDSNREQLLENGNLKGTSRTEEEVHHGMTVSVQNGKVRRVLSNLQVVLLGTKLSVLLPTIPLSFVAVYCGFGKVSAS